MLPKDGATRTIFGALMQENSRLVLLYAPSTESKCDPTAEAGTEQRNSDDDKYFVLVLVKGWPSRPHV